MKLKPLLRRFSNRYVTPNCYTLGHVWYVYGSMPGRLTLRCEECGKTQVTEAP